MSNNKDTTAIEVSNVSKTFKLPHEKQTSLKGAVLSSFRPKSYELQKAVNDVSFEVKKGEFFGIVGRNGSGKSTLLKCIAGVYTPNKGSIKINGSLVPFIELGVGFNPELSGRDNVFLNGALIGFNRKRMEAMYDDIVAFAELERFMDQKLKNYSSGMQVRLAFSIAIRAKSDILLLDEVLAVGDSAFQQKCYDYFASLKEEKKTIILVSHSMPTIERFCDRALLLEYGVVKNIGTSSEIAGLYDDMILQEEAIKRSEALGQEGDADQEEVLQASVSVVQNGKTTKSAEAFKPLQFVIKLKSSEDLPKTFVGLNLRNSENQVVLAIDLIDHIGDVRLIKKTEKEIRIELDNIFNNGTYYFTLGVADSRDTSRRQLLKKRNIASFTVFGVRKNLDAIVHPTCKVTEL